MAVKKKNKVSAAKNNNASAFSASDFTVKAYEDNARYALDFPDNTNFNVSVPCGSSATVTSWISASFSPVSALSSVPLTDLLLVGENSRWGVIGTDQGSLPINLVNDGTGSSQVIYISASYDNTINVNDLIDTDLGYQYWLGVAELSANSTDTIGAPGSAENGTSDSFIGALSAEGGDITYDLTVPMSGLDCSVSYGSVSPSIDGTGYLSTSSILGDGVGISSVNTYIYLSGDTTHFSPLSIPVPNPTTMPYPGGFITAITTYDNTYLHADDIHETINVVVSTSNAQLAAGWDGIYTPATTEFIAGTYTLTAIGDSSAPSGVSGFTVTPGQTRVKLSWTNPTDSDLSAAKVQYALGTVAPATYTDGITIYLEDVVPGTVTTTEIVGLTGNQSMAYSVWVVDNIGDWSTELVQASAIPFTNNIYGTDAFPYLTNAQIRGRFIDEGVI